ncbi:cytosolic carboxypeptidase Nna1-like [Teleopsis dalmanni]|uniref:cytosolic carboxypeptidase Nna1-like n=1 Tax=Teleopsis dalmanni TaxID=139649 RepID=UPI0018CEB859|nr:cytosolic carboxypeptidase Nna1-like [Teleopsis dalmanni]
MDEKSGFLGTFLAKGLKTNQLEVNTDEKTLRPIARLKEPRDLFALPKDKDNVCSQQAPRWPVECQVIEERIIHIPYVPILPEPLNAPTGNEIKPRPVGEENGTVVFNYNPISAVNYDNLKKKPADDSSDTDSDIESVDSEAEKQTDLKIEKSITKILESMSSSNSNEDDDDDDDSDGDECDVDSDTSAMNMRKQKSLKKKKEHKEIPKIVEDEIEDIWANKTPEYKPSTPIPVRHRKRTQEVTVNEEAANGGEVLAPTFVPNKNDLKENIIIKVASIINEYSVNSEEGEEHDLKQNDLKTKLLDNIQELRNKNVELEVKGNIKCKENAQNKENAQTQSKQNNSNETQINNDNEQNADDDSLNLPQFSRSSVGGSKILTNCHPFNPIDYDGLEFESRFESGNLAKAVQITPSYYELYLRSDLYTSRSKQWFYFRVKKTRKNRNYRFSIVNLVKSDSLFNDGMRPVMYSTIDAKQSKIGWRRCGENISYYHNEDSSGEEEENASFTLTFNIEFQYDNDTVYFAHCYPYTYSDLQDYLMNIQKDPIKSKFCKLRLLCRSLAGNNVYYLTVTAPSPDEHSLRRKKSIVVSARVHPSETPSSWMMKGLMDFITGETIVAKRLRHKFIFKLIPMLNPDGVIVGNTRNSLTGKDLNRQYRTVIREYYPSIWYTKALIKRLVDECGVAMYCDMHAHSRRHNIFVYGCENKRNPEKKLTEQVFPLMMHKNVADKFSFECCKFKVQRSKEGTGRIVVWMLGITNSYTIEASFGGTSLGSRKGTHFNTGNNI